MLKKIIDFLADIPATLIGGVLLILSFVLSKTDIHLIPDPAWGTVLLCGTPLLYLAIWRMFYNTGIRRISSALLISIAMIAAIIIGDLFAAGEVAFIMALGAILEDLTTKRAKKGLQKLVCLTPTQGRKLTGTTEQLMPAEKIVKNDILRILPGETIPVDGIILSGETSIDQSIITGESLPVDKGIHDTVFCGTINRFGTIDIQATKIGQDSSLQKLIQMIREAENKKAPTQRIADICASWLVPAAFLIAIITGIMTKDIVRAVTVLVVFCPCALVLATPTAIMAAIGQATRHGIIIKSGEALEKMGKVDTIAFDKTGTLTLGNLRVSDVISLCRERNEKELVSLAASAESKSEHPLAKAIVAFARENNIPIQNPLNFKMTSGKGIYAEVNGQKLHLRNERFFKETSICMDAKRTEQLAQLRMQGKACMLIAKDNHCIGILALSDSLRPQANTVIKKLHMMHTNSILLTGDNKKTAAHFAKQAGISEIYAQLLPAEKVKYINQMIQQGKTVCMIGDGVNDAPALKSADVGIAMGSMGSDIAVEAADIALMSDDITKIPYVNILPLNA